jgi:hypothetical protein
MHRRTKIGLLLIIPTTMILSGCSMLKPSSREKAMDNERNEQKAAASEMKAMEKAHYKAQTRETRKMMKQSRKSSKKLNKVKKN